MSVIIRVKRGAEQKILESSMQLGELAFSTDTCSLWGYNGIYKCVVGRAIVDDDNNKTTYSGSVGRLFYASDTENFYVHDGAEWNNITISGGGEATLSGVGGIETSYQGGIWFIDGSNISAGVGNIVFGTAQFADGGTNIYHGLGNTDHFTVAIPEGEDAFDRWKTAAVGEIYIQVGENEDTVYKTGGSYSDGVQFKWYATTSGTGQNYVSDDDLSTVSGTIIQYINDLVTTVSGDLVDQIPVVSANGNLMGTGTFSTSGYVITHNLNTTDHRISVTPADTTAFNRWQIAAVGEVYVQKGLNQDTVYKTGGPYSDGVSFDWEIVKDGLKMIEAS